MDPQVNGNRWQAQSFHTFRRSSRRKPYFVNPADVNFGTVSINQSEFEFILRTQNAKTTVNKVYIDASSDSFKNLIGYWKLDGDAQDSSGHGHDGQAFNATPTTDRFGQYNQAYAFDGDGDYIEIPHSDTPNAMPTSITFGSPSEYNEMVVL